MYMVAWRWYIQMKRLEKRREICNAISTHTHILHKQYYGVYKAGFSKSFSAEKRLLPIQIQSSESGNTISTPFLFSFVG